MLFLPSISLLGQGASNQQVDYPDTVKMNLKGGLSPEGKYQIWVIGAGPMRHGYAFGFYGGDSPKLLFQAQVGGGFCVQKGASEIDSALWNGDESMVAIQDHGTRHSMEIYVLLIKGHKAIEVHLPQYGAAVSKAMENLHGGAETAWILKPLKWEGSKFTFRLYGGPNMSDVTIKIRKSDSPDAELISETPPKQINGMQDC